jgi:hypothetical protein
MRRKTPITWRIAEESQLPDVKETERIADLALLRLAGILSSLTAEDVEYRECDTDGEQKFKKG